MKIVSKTGQLASDIMIIHIMKLLKVIKCHQLAPIASEKVKWKI